MPDPARPACINPVLSMIAACALASCSHVAPARKTETLILDVAPVRVDCVGVAAQKCLVVNGEYFYGDIQGFDFTEGNRYRLLVERAQWCDPRDCPEDASPYHYRLIEVLEGAPGP